MIFMNDNTAYGYVDEFLPELTGESRREAMVMVKTVDRDCRHAAAEIAIKHQAGIMNVKYECSRVSTKTA